jgi:hypothetical protein
MLGAELIIGAVMPVLVELIGRFVKNSNLKFIVSLLLPLLAGAALNWGSLNAADAGEVLGSGAIIFAAAQGVYKLYFRDSSLQKRLSS